MNRKSRRAALALARCLIIAVVAPVVLAGCASNIRDIPTAQAPVPKQKSFNAPVDRVWTATQRFLSDGDTFKVLDKSSGIMVTEMRTIEAKELSLMQTAFLGKTYKHSYTVNFMQNGGNATDVRVNVKLQATQVALLSREESNEDVEAFLRQRLFDGIAANLR